MISVVVPVYNEEGSIINLHRRILEVMTLYGCDFEIIFVNDGSKDNTEKLALSLTPLKFISLQRNYGQTAAIDVGIHNASGDIIVLIDADLQNDPQDIIKLLTKLDEGFDVAVGRRIHRYDHWTRVLFSKVANFIARNLLKIPLHDFGCGLKVYRSKFIKDFRLWGEAQVFLPAVAQERGARLVEVPIPHFSRESGVANVKISKMVKGVFDLLGIIFFVRYFSKPLRFFGTISLVTALLSLLIFGASVYLRLMGILNFSDTPLPIIGSLFAMLTVVLFMMGFLSEMVLRLHYLIGDSSPYMIREVTDR